MGHIRLQCVLNCRYNKPFIKDYTKLKKCAEKCAAHPSQSVREAASIGQKVCKKEVPNRDKNICEAISTKRDITELVLNIGNTTDDRCPLGAKVNGKKCVCPLGSSVDKSHTKCKKESMAPKELKENITLIKELLSEDQSSTKEPVQAPAAQKQESLSPQAPQTTPEEPWYVQCTTPCQEPFSCHNVEGIFAHACSTPLYNSDRTRKDCEGMKGRQVGTWCVRERN